MKSSICYP